MADADTNGIDKVFTTQPGDRHLREDPQRQQLQDR